MTKTSELIALEEQVALTKTRRNQAQEALNETEIEYQNALMKLEKFNQLEMNLNSLQVHEYEMTGSD